MPGDFGDEMGELVVRELKEIVQKLVPATVNYVKRSREKYLEDVADGKRSADLENERFKDARVNGKNEYYDFQDGKPQDFQFDLSAFEGEDMAPAKEALDATLREAGIDPARLVPEMRDVLDKASGKLDHSEPTGRYNITFQDNEVEAMDFVTDHYYDNVLLDPRIQESMGLEELHLHLGELKNVPVEARESLVNELKEAAGLDGEALDIAHDERGNITGISTRVPAEQAREARANIEKAWSEHLAQAKVGRNWPKRFTFAPESAIGRTAVTTARVAEAESLSKLLVAEGILDARVHVDSAGKIEIAHSIGSTPQINDAIGKHEARKLFNTAKSHAQQKPSEAAIKSWSQQKAHAATAAEDMKKLGQQVIDPTRALRDQLPVKALRGVGK